MIQKGVPMILVPDIARSLDWYTTMGFKELGRYEEDGVVNFGMVSFGNAELMFRLGETPKPSGGDIWLGRDVTLWFYTDAIDEQYQFFKPRAQIAEDLYEPFYGGRQFSIVDPNGYILIFLEPAKS